MSQHGYVCVLRDLLQCFEVQSLLTVCRLCKAFYETPFPSPALCFSKGNTSGIVLNCAALAISSNRTGVL